MYFHFSPTLVYRDTYVRTKSIRIKFIIKNLLTFIVVIFYQWCLVKAITIPVFKNTATNPGDLRTFINTVFISSISGITVLLSMFYGILHTWFNMWAELLKFGDRQFYEDWWNVKDFENYYRKWNIVVHEFLYYYIF